MEEMINILIIEDSATQLEHLKGILEKLGYNVAAAENGKQALKVLEDYMPDIIVSDIIMPEMDGYEFCNQVRKDEKFDDIPIILLTALNDPRDVIKGINVGADNFISKPFSTEFLLSRIKHLVLNNKLRKESTSDAEFQVFFAGKKYEINSHRSQIIDLLLSTYENAVNKNNELVGANLMLNELKENLEAKNQELATANEEKNHFIGMAAHDIRNPLGSIYNFVDLIKEDLEGKLNETQIEFFDIVKDSVQLLLNMVTELLDVSKIEASKLELKLKPENMVDFIKRNLDRNKYLADKKNIELAIKYSDDEINLSFDANRMEQVVNNLVSNAIKYSKSGTQINIELKHLDDHIMFSVRDNGVGIPNNEMDKLFKPFSKTSATTTAGESSTGLGLFTCKKIIDAHGGEIGAKSQRGKGSTFFFSLPMSTVRKVASKISTKSDSYYDILDGLKILVVDDIDMNFAYFKATFGKWPVSLEWVTDGKRAVEIVQENDYDVILMDIHLPGMNGLDATRQIRTFNTDVVIICQTAYSMEGTRDKCIQAGCNDYMSMPIRPKEVIESIIENLKKNSK